PASGAGAGAVAAAATRVGVPYEWGGAPPGVGFDCSGLVMWAYGQVGISLPHSSSAQFAAGFQVPMSDLQPGDLVFYSDPSVHVAIYVGGGSIIEAPTFGQTVHVIPMYSQFVQAVRIA
ncbi:MAG: C40 family peptidase, partial [Acidimicrobiaceae bacterium]|nr:C40 family peptidase [Acidimicrobiaceae bacterium]